MSLFDLSSNSGTKNLSRVVTHPIKACMEEHLHAHNIKARVSIILNTMFIAPSPLTRGEYAFTIPDMTNPKFDPDKYCEDIISSCVW